MAKPAPRQLTVLRCAQVTPNMRRITVGGENMAGFPPDQGSGYIKIMLRKPGEETPMLRTYTIRHQRENPAELDIDFAMHGEGQGGPASTWAMQTKPGDLVTIGGPGPKKLLDFSADWFLAAGDMTALPAMSVSLELLPENARGYAAIEVIDETDIQAFDTPPGFEIHWVVNPEPGSSTSPLLNKVKQFAWLEGRPSIWAAAEFNTMRALRSYFKQERQVSRHDMYISSYWKKGLSEEQHKVVKGKDAKTEEAIPA